MFRPALVACVTLSACGPAMTTPDAGGVCRDGVKTPANLIENPGFECDGSEWAAVSTYGTFDFAPGRTGRAGRITFGGLGGRLQYTKSFAPSPAGNRTYCFSAWLSGTAPFMRLRVLRDFDGSVQEVSFAEQVFPEFRRIPTLKVTADNAPKLILLFEMQTNRTDGQNAVAGHTMLIDDVDVWESTTNCAESR